MAQSIYRASGKVLLAGGYGVLEQNNHGLSIAVGRHYYSWTSIVQGQRADNQIIIEVESPQIKGRWIYRYSCDLHKIEEVSQKVNPFVQNAIRYSLQYCLSKLIKEVNKIKIFILFDRGFLSEPVNLKDSKIKFINYEGEYSKTGLGSSACVTVVIVGGILKQLLPKFTLEEVNALSQIANIAAQNKIGSNFDISTAVYGSQLYKNVLPRKAFSAVESGDIQSVMKTDPQVEKLKVGKMMENSCCCWMLDLRRGSNTRAMVSGFIKALRVQPAGLEKEFYEISKKMVKKVSQAICSDLSRQQLIDNLKKANKEYREFIQLYSKYTGVPVEPPEFKELLDGLCSLKETAYCICPGSGGYDAIVVLSILAEGQTISQIEGSISDVCRGLSFQCSIEQLQLEWSGAVLSEGECESVFAFLKQ